MTDKSHPFNLGKIFGGAQPPDNFDAYKQEMIDTGRSLQMGRGLIEALCFDTATPDAELVKDVILGPAFALAKAGELTPHAIDEVLDRILPVEHLHRLITPGANPVPLHDAMPGQDLSVAPAQRQRALHVVACALRVDFRLPVDLTQDDVFAEVHQRLRTGIHHQLEDMYPGILSNPVHDFWTLAKGNALTQALKELRMKNKYFMTQVMAAGNDPGYEGMEP